MAYNLEYNMGIGPEQYVEPYVGLPVEGVQINKKVDLSNPKVLVIEIAVNE